MTFLVDLKFYKFDVLKKNRFSVHISQLLELNPLDFNFWSNIKALMYVIEIVAEMLQNRIYGVTKVNRLWFK